MLTVIYKVALIDNQKVRSTVIQLMAVPVGIALDHRIVITSTDKCIKYIRDYPKESLFR